MLSKIRAGLEDPGKIPPYILAKILPSSVIKQAPEHIANWKKEGDIYTFNEGGFASGPGGRPEFSARCFYEIKQIYDILEEYDVSADQSVEIGAGYGRLSAWIARFSSEHYAIEPNSEAINKARKLYPHIQWEENKLQDTSLTRGDFDLIITWTVLQHIPDSIQQPANTIMELSSGSGYLLICEETQGDSDTHTWPRDIEEYDNIFKNMELLDTWNRSLEPGNPHGGTAMLFKND